MTTTRPITATDVPDLGTVLGIWAHPDDEVYLSGGLMATARAAGQRVACVTATLGELGTPDADRWPPERLSRVRKDELRASLAVLGVTEHYHLGLPDGGCADQSEESVVARLVEIIDDVRPDTILSFGPDGVTGHSDHQVVSRWATAARSKAAAGARLLYATTTGDYIDTWQTIYERFDIFLAEGLPIRTPADALAVDFRLDDELADRKFVALRAQASQTTSLTLMLGEETMQAWSCSVESFVDAESAVVDGSWGTWRPRAAS